MLTQNDFKLFLQKFSKSLSNSQLEELAQQIKACLLCQINPYEILPLEKHVGRWDFRGLDLTIELSALG